MVDVLQDGTSSITIKFSAEAIRKFTQLERNILSYNDLTAMWDDIEPYVRENIKYNLDYGVEPDGTPWAALRDAYAQIVGRPFMSIGPLSPIYQAYVLAPIVDKQPMRMMYSASPLIFDVDHPVFYDLALRFGFIAGGFAAGTPVVGREWFGLNDHTIESINKVMGFRIQQRIGENLS